MNFDWSWKGFSYLFHEIILIHEFSPSILLNLPSLCTNTVIYICHFSKQLDLGCPYSTTAIKLNGTVHQNHRTVYQILPKNWCKWLEQFVKQMVQFIKTSKNIDEYGKQSSLEEDSVKIIGTRPKISYHESPIGQTIEIQNPNRFREKWPDNDRKNCRQHDYLYYQPQHGVQNHRKRYSNDRIIQRASYKNDYDRNKGVAHGMILSGTHTPEK